MAKNCWKRLVDSDGFFLVDDLPDSNVCIKCIEANAGSDKKGYASVQCAINNEKRLVGARFVRSGSVYLCGIGYGKNALFSYDLDCLSSSLNTLSRIEGDIEKYKKEEYVARIRRVFHNVRNINAHALQEMRALIPEQILRQHKNKSVEDVESLVESRPNDTALTLFRISKDLNEIKSEFSIYSRLINGDQRIDKRPYNIRDIIMLVVYPFFEDFNKKDVVVNVDFFYGGVPVDFETFQVAIYHIIENASKYIRPHTNAQISFKKESGIQVIEIEMKSLHIEEEEVGAIFLEGHSGKEAIRSKLNGDGIGLYRAKRFIEMNGGTLSVYPGLDKDNYKGLMYSDNRFVLTLPLY